MPRRISVPDQSLNPTDGDMPLAAVYARVSSEDQARGFSLPTQVDACLKYAVHQGYSVSPEHVLTDDVTGTILDRPMLHQGRGARPCRNASEARHVW